VSTPPSRGTVAQAVQATAAAWAGYPALRDSVLARFDGNPERAAADRAAVLAGIGLQQVRIAIVAASCPPDVVGFWRALGVPLNIEELCSE
jgi:hypothetical protein